MIFKVFYQDRKDRSPRRETTKSLYLEVDCTSELEGKILARKLVEENTSYNVEHLHALSEDHLAYEKESGAFTLTEF